jgi:hypothetical protein
MKNEIIIRIAKIIPKLKNNNNIMEIIIHLYYLWRWRVWFEKFYE